MGSNGILHGDALLVGVDAEIRLGKKLSSLCSSYDSLGRARRERLGRRRSKRLLEGIRDGFSCCRRPSNLAKGVVLDDSNASGHPLCERKSEDKGKLQVEGGASETSAVEGRERFACAPEGLKCCTSAGSCPGWKGEDADNLGCC
jgi:hypothetical protein